MHWDTLNKVLLHYSPVLNTIENVFSKLKALVRSATSRTQRVLQDATADALRLITPADCSNYFKASSYYL